LAKKSICLSHRHVNEISYAKTLNLCSQKKSLKALWKCQQIEVILTHKWHMCRNVCSSGFFPIQFMWEFIENVLKWWNFVSLPFDYLLFLHNARQQSKIFFASHWRSWQNTEIEIEREIIACVSDLMIEVRKRYAYRN
jgi:hypothetical protein